MSMPPDFITQLLQGQNGLYSPTMGLAAGLLQAGGPSRIPVSLGQALGQGLQTGQQFQQAGLQNAMQQLMLGKTGAQLQWMMHNPLLQQSQPTQQQDESSQPPVDSSFQRTPTSDALNALISGATPQQARQIDNSPLLPNQNSQPQLGVKAPVQDGITDVSQDPTYAYYAQGAQFGIPEAATLAGQRKDIIMGSPQYQASVERAKSFAGLQNVRQGGAVYDPSSGQVLFQNPHLPTGGILNSDRSVSIAPGALSAISQSEQAQAQGSLFGKPATGVITSGPQTGATYQSTVGNLTNGGRGGGAITALPPAQSAGMPEAGKASTDRANTAIEQQKAAQQTIGQLGQLQANLEALGTGPGKETQLEVKKGLASIGGFLGFPGLANADLTNAAAARKSIVNLTAPMVRAMGAREPFQMVNFIRDGMASISNPQDANGVVLGMLRGIAEYQNDTGKYAGTWLNQNSGAGFVPGKGAWDANWQQQADPGAYIFDNLPKFEQQSIINAAQKNPSLLAEIQRMAKSKKTLTSQGFMLSEGQ